MGVPLKQQIRLGLYILGKKLRGEKRYPLVLMLEPLFRCNLACSGCGKIDYPDHILDKRISVQEAMDAIDECGAPVVSIAGGEPLIHKEMPQIVEGYIKKKKYIYLCTNALLLKKRIKDYTPSEYLTFSIHLDGNQDRHDASVCQDGVFERAIDAVRLAKEKGFRVTVNCTLFQGEAPEEVAEFFDHVNTLGIEGVTIAPGFSYERAPEQEVFLQRKSPARSSSATSSVSARAAAGRSITPACTWISSLVIRTMRAPRGGIRPATSSVGRGPATCWWARVTPPRSTLSWTRRTGTATASGAIPNAVTAWCTAASRRRRSTMRSRIR